MGRWPAAVLPAWLGLLAALVFPGPSQAGDPGPRWYQVEVVVFVPRHPEDLGAEVWPADPGMPPGLDAAPPVPGLEPGPAPGPASDLVPEPAPPAAGGAAPAGAAAPEGPGVMEAEPGGETARDGTGAEPAGGGETAAAAVLLPVPREERQLNDVWRSLELARDYRPLLHAAWRQTVPPAEGRLPVRIYGGEALAWPAAEAAPGPDAPPPGTPPDHAADTVPPAAGPSATATEAGTPDETVTGTGTGTPAAAPVFPVDGLVTVYLGRYLHLEADLVRTLLLPRQARFLGEPSPPVPVRFRMQQHRRMRSRETHYLDHPALGLVARIVPWEPPVTGEPPAAETRPPGPAAAAAPPAP